MYWALRSSCYSQSHLQNLSTAARCAGCGRIVGFRWSRNSIVLNTLHFVALLGWECTVLPDHFDFTRRPIKPIAKQALESFQSFRVSLNISNALGLRHSIDLKTRATGMATQWRVSSKERYQLINNNSIRIVVCHLAADPGLLRTRLSIWKRHRSRLLLGLLHSFSPADPYWHPGCRSDRYSCRSLL